jgi:hypothetical protein
MTTGDDQAPGAGGARDDRRDGRAERIGVGGGDDNVTRIQLAARWSEAYAPPNDSLGAILKRFRAAYEYLDAVTHGVEPVDVEAEQPEVAHTPPAPVPPAPAPAPEAPPPIQSEPRPW